VETIQATTDALYRSICFRKGEQPDYDLLHSLFTRDARMTNNDNPAAPDIMTVEEFIHSLRTAVENRHIESFREHEIASIVEQFGSIAHTFSTYEARFDYDAEKPHSVGINSIQFVYNGSRWHICSMIWNNETPERVIPERYLPTSL
jgi:hypothetical protein